MHRSAPAAIAALLLASALRPQDDDHQPPKWSREELARHLAASDLADVAWAGWFVSRDKLRALVPDVRRALARFQGTDGLEGELARLELLDCLVQMHVRLPGEELLPHAIGYLRVPALVIAAFSPCQNLSYFAARMEQEDLAESEWIACGNMLATHAATGFAADCLRGLEWPLTVVVRDGIKPPSRAVG